MLVPFWPALPLAPAEPGGPDGPEGPDAPAGPDGPDGPLGPGDPGVPAGPVAFHDTEIAGGAHLYGVAGLIVTFVKLPDFVARQAEYTTVELVGDELPAIASDAAPPVADTIARTSTSRARVPIRRL